VADPALAQKLLRRAAAWISLATAGVAILVLLGTLLGRPALAALGRGQVPGSPLGALAILVPCVALLLAGADPRHPWPRRFAMDLALGIALVDLVILSFPWVETAWGGSRLPLVGHPSQPTSPLTALATLAACLATLTVVRGQAGRWRIRQAGALMAQVPLLLGTLVLISYAVGAPLMYESNHVPMSLPSALGAVGLGLALVIHAGVDTWPLAVFGFAPRQEEPFQAHWFAAGPLALFLALGVLILSGGSFYLRGQLKAQGSICVETVHRRRDGSRLPVEVSARFVRLDAAPQLLSIVHDLTERKRAEQERLQLQAQLQLAQKMESLGSLAGGVAHDMNNVLGAILSLASAQQEREPASKYLATIVNACLRGRGVVKSLLYFAHKDLQEERELDLQEDLGSLRGDAGALSHALMNLCVNAVDALPSGGSLHLQTRALATGELEVRVRDTGEGMGEEVLAKAMEPFFTTKPVGKGTGLGLPMVYGTMRAHEGSLSLSSRIGHGTEAILRFPASRVGKAESSRQVPEPAGPLQRALDILVVDDDELIRESMTEVVKLLGHRVATASGGQEALDLLQKGMAVDLVVLDMNMPGLNGAQTLARILDLVPGQRVFLASGGSDLEIAPLAANQPNVSALPKPFSLEELRLQLGNLARSGSPSPAG
jgi:signal transduction histidine kinase/CheY-like chemotaxis protein